MVAKGCAADGDYVCLWNRMFWKRSFDENIPKGVGRSHDIGSMTSKLHCVVESNTKNDEYKYL